MLDQEKSDVVSLFFEQISPDDIFVSDFTIHSIGVILSRDRKDIQSWSKRLDLFSGFLEDLFVNAQIGQLSLIPDELMQVISNMQEYALDFDDAYQLTISQKHDLIIITFDKDFNAKGIRKSTPEEIILNQGTTDWKSLIG
jgi:hypothetical protein